MHVKLKYAYIFFYEQIHYKWMCASFHTTVNISGIRETSTVSQIIKSANTDLTQEIKLQKPIKSIFKMVLFQFYLILQKLLALFV